MENLKETALLKFRPDTLHTVRKMFNLDKPGRMDEAIDILDQWIKKQNHFACKEFERTYLERIIINSKGSIEAAKSRMDRLCTMRTIMPDYFLFEIVNHVDNFGEYALLPELSQEGYRTFLYRVRENAVFTDKTLNEILMNMVPDASYIVNNDYNTGIVGVTDLRTLNLMDAVSKINFSFLRAGLALLRHGFGIRIKALHYISSSSFLENMLSLLKPVLPAKIASRIHIHRSFETLYDFVPRELLSKDYGGNAPPLSELHELRIKEVTSEEHKQHIEKMRQCLVDESKRIGERPDVDYLPGTFRNLTVD